MVRRFLIICFIILVLLQFSALGSEAQDKQLNELYIVVNNIDYTNNILYADVEIHVFLEAANEFSYIILPIAYSSVDEFFIETSSERNTILSGYLDGNGSYVIQIAPLNKQAEYFLTIKNIRLPVFPTSNERSFGYYAFTSYDIKGDVSYYNKNLVVINRIYVSNTNVLRTEPAATREDDRNMLMFPINNESYDVKVFLAKQAINNGFIAVLIVIGITLVTGFIPAIIKKDYDELLKRRVKIIIPVSVIGLALLITVFVLYIPNEYRNDLTFLSIYWGLLGIIIGVIARTLIVICKP